MTPEQKTLEALIEENRLLKEEVARQKHKNSELREAAGAWRRKAQDKNPRPPQKLNEKHMNGYHSFSLKLDHIPADLAMHEVMSELKKGFLAEWYPYQYSGLYHHQKNGWHVQLSDIVYVNLSTMLETREEEVARERLQLDLYEGLK